MITIANAKRYLGITDRSCTIVGNGSLATITLDDHGFKTGDQVEFGSSSISGFNGVHQVTRVSANVFTFISSTSGTASSFIVKFDFILDLLVAGVEHFINNYTGVNWVESTTFTNEIFDCPSDGLIYIPNMPLLSVSDIKISANRDFSAGQYTQLTVDEFLVYPTSGKVELLGSAASNVFGARKSVKITYATTVLPTAIKLAGYQLLSYYFRTWNMKAENITSRTNEGEQIVFAKAIPKDIKEMLDPYKRMIIGGVDPRAARPTYF